MSAWISSSELTYAERRVATLIAEGYSTKEISRRLEVSPKTIDSHRQNIMRKVNAKNMACVVRYAIREGLVSI